jgi:hypothetical protein
LIRFVSIRVVDHLEEFRRRIYYYYHSRVQRVAVETVVF